MKQNLLLLSILICLAAPYGASAQTDTGTGQQIENYAGFYQNTYQDQAVLFLGKVQQPLSKRTESLYLRNRSVKELDESGREKFPTPIPSRESYGKGNLEYDGVYYSNVFLRLDLYRDELVVRTPNEVYGIILDPTRVAYADFRGYHVIYIDRKNQGNLPIPGYYLELYNNGIRVLKKEFFEFNRLEDKFVHRTIRYYILRDGVAQRVRPRKGSILKALGNHRREMDQFIRRMPVELKKDPESALVLIASEFERLNK